MSDDELIHKTLVQVFDSILLNGELGSMNEIVVNDFDDHLDSLTLQMAKSQLDTSQLFDKAFYTTADMLLDILDTAPKLDFGRFRGQNRYVLIDGTDTMLEYDYNNPRSLGFSTVSHVQLNIPDKIGMYYVDLQCGDDCGGGYLVVFNLVEDKWELKTVLNIWD